MWQMAGALAHFCIIVWDIFWHYFMFFVYDQNIGKSNAVHAGSLVLTRIMSISC